MYEATEGTLISACAFFFQGGQCQLSKSHTLPILSATWSMVHCWVQCHLAMDTLDIFLIKDAQELKAGMS